MATELSEQVSDYLENKQYVEAIGAVTRAWNEAGEFGVRHCSLPDYAETWVKFKTRGYPFSLREKWDNTTTYKDTLTIVLGYIADWNFTDISGQPIALPADGSRPTELVDNLEDGLLFWLVREFTYFWLYELPKPRKNF